MAPAKLKVFGFNCSLKSARDKEKSSTQVLLDQLMDALAEHGANLNARNLRGQTPLGALVARKARPNMIELLRKLGAGM